MLVGDEILGGHRRVRVNSKTSSAEIIVGYKSCSSTWLLSDAEASGYQRADCEGGDTDDPQEQNGPDQEVGSCDKSRSQNTSSLGTSPSSCASFNHNSCFLSGRRDGCTVDR